MKTTFELKGVQELTQRMRQLAEEIPEKAVRSALAAAGNELKKALIPAAPYLEGTPVHIRSEFQVSRSRTRSGKGRMVFTVGVKYGKEQHKDNALNRRLKRVGKSYKTEGAAFYWKFNEFGSKHQPSKPFIRPVVQANAQRLTEIITEKLDKALTRFEQKGGLK